MEIETQSLPEGGTLVEISHIQCGNPRLVKGIADAAACRAGMLFSHCLYGENDNIQFNLHNGDNEAFWQYFNEYRQQLGLLD